MRLRQWHQDDVSQVDSLLQPSADPLWVKQFHALHGPDRDGSGWSRTMVAVDTDGRMVGCATVAESLLHGSRLPCAIDVAPHARRRGIGTRLLKEMRALRLDDSRPLSTKVRQRDSVAMAFVSAVGGRMYQRSPGIVVNPRATGIQQWVQSRPVYGCRNLEETPIPELAQAFAALYEWIHRPWSPVTSEEVLSQTAAMEASDIDRAGSAGFWRDGQLLAVAFAFDSTEGVEVVAETIRPDEPGGIDAVADAVAMVIGSAERRDRGFVAFDSHLSDPHLQPVLAALPHVRTHPLDLIEIS